MANEVVFSPQITAERIESIVQQGFKTVINNRPDGEELDQPTSKQIADACEQAGLAYGEFLFSGNDLTEQLVTEFAKYFNQAEQPVFMFCRSGNRSHVIYQAAVQLGLISE
ncbi:MAG: TIGR01244 family phosphatase [Gammaproteobacteria bacterium]|nr:MAG: TIGR01244 family phosphatase [Gammaproteobacteria bacterium]